MVSVAATIGCLVSCVPGDLDLYEGQLRGKLQGSSQGMPASMLAVQGNAWVELSYPNLIIQLSISEIETKASCDQFVRYSHR